MLAVVNGLVGDVAACSENVDAIVPGIIKDGRVDGSKDECGTITANFFWFFPILGQHLDAGFTKLTS